ncbi:antibiotic biosynthesis monooxygenase [Rhizobiaceae bacterium]|nr:antibiotic biosynthesis monooxygenase [Rhizobiaceae bacterium]
MIYVVAEVDLKPGHFAEIEAAAHTVAEATRKEDGCISYVCHQPMGEPDRIVFVERWRDRDALQAHFTQPHMGVWQKALKGHVEGRNIEIIHPEKVETL